jgi:ParB-like chromosome segregation protein Spo0J
VEGEEMSLEIKIENLIKELSVMGTEKRIEALNEIKKSLHVVSPFKNEPVDCVLWIPSEKVEANDYNPNAVAPPEMKLLEVSILADGYTQPIVTDYDETANMLVVVDGFHRNRVARESETVRERVMGYLPVVQIRPDQTGRPERIASTIRHNRARGKHQVEKMSQIVLELKRRNWSDEKIGRELGMDPDEVLRLCQITGLAEAFKDKDFSKAWEVDLTADDAEVEALTEEIEEDA